MRKRSLSILLVSLCICLTACSAPISDTSSNDHVVPVSVQRVVMKVPSTKDILSIIPVGWKILDDLDGEQAIAKGDLNKDGLADVVAVIEAIDSDSSEEASPRSLIIAFGNKDHTYSLSIKAETAILRANEGGVWGDPFESITIDRGSVLLSFYGGSNWRWFSSYRFRFQKDDWYLIGATLGSYFTGTTTSENADVEDYNLLTGDYVFKKADDKGKPKISTGNRGKKKLVKLKDFRVDSEKNQF
ncbi:hypothetical protein [Paenibacillus sp. IHBB 10380]|uniref:hypothetical protein n=1 Tax=Paenibacillus sp. IHBB 10380 TaxID=1566358 RepID=UPI0005CFA261|nr:hypothetical protein [Paenibacillus sp. IHBB 10380]AJS59368.1 hypothetical protein UB51_13855 [Paenibacillus sp. IHBB 10380]